MYQFFEGIRYLDQYPENSPPGKTYLLIHGLGGSLEQWLDVGRSLAAANRVIAVDIPGFGDSRPAGRPFALEKSIEHLGRFVEMLGMRGAILVSHSIGCVVAARLAALSPKSFDSVVLVSGALIRASDIAQNPRHAIRHPRVGLFVGIQVIAGSVSLPPSVLRVLATYPLLRKLAFSSFVSDPGRLDSEQIIRLLAGAGSPAVLKIMFSAAEVDYEFALRSVGQPVELVWGAGDPLITTYDLARLRELVDVIREKEIPDCGHWPWLEKVPDLVGFLAESGDHAADLPKD